MAAVKTQRRSKAQISKAAAEQKKDAAHLGKLDIEYVPIDDVKPNQYNPNRQSEHDFQLLCRSIAEDGFTRPIVVRRGSNEIVDGEHRWRGCKALGHTEIPVVYVEMTDAQARIATLKYNRIHGSEDANLSAAVLKEIVEMGAADWAQDSLMMDDVEMARLREELAIVETEGMSVEIPESMLGPSGKGISAQDGESNMDYSADETRAKQKILAAAKEQEEREMAKKDNEIYRVVSFFVGDEARIVRHVLGNAAAATLLAIIREEAAKQPVAG